MSAEYTNLGREDFRSPEHWDGHGFEDDCPSRPPSLTIESSLKNDRGAENEAKRTLKNVLETGTGIPLKTFEVGESFDGASYPEGTVIKFVRESLSTDSTKGKWEHSRANEYWGVISGYEYKGERQRVLFSYPASEIMTSEQRIYPGFSMDLQIEAGAVIHTKIKSKRRLSQNLKRHSNLSIFVFGEPAAEKEKSPSYDGFLRRVLIPGSGIVFES